LRNLHILSKIKWHIVFSFLLLLPFCGLKAQVTDTSKVPVHDSLETDPEDEVVMPVAKYTDSILIPAYYIYHQWDTVNIHPMKVDMTKMHDSIFVKLVCDQNCDFVNPYIGNTTSNFGYRHYRPHLGIDIDLETGDTVRCAFDGRVRIAKLNKSYGNVVIVRHNNGLETIYAHLSKILVHADSVVSAGTVLGLGGSTGHSTGSHLHFEVRYLGNAINPSDVINFKDHKLLKDTLKITKNNFKYIVPYSSAGGKRYYTIKKGDTLSKIAKKNGTTVGKICKLNGLKPSSILKVGKKIRVR
jgi:murein DD-endopeptidase MepM/ murein hydrolase activator NlpD